VLFKSVNVTPVAGTVFVKLPRGAKLSRDASASSTKGQGFIPLTEARQIPVGSVLDTSRGTVGITAASTTHGKTYTADVSAGLFELLQDRTQKGLTDFSLMDTVSQRAVCASVGKGTKASAARKTASSTVLGLLRSSDHGGRFATRGHYSSATVRGTQYSVADTCAGTLTTVQRGSVVVDYFRRHKNVVVNAGHAFLARSDGAKSSPYSIGKSPATGRRHP
jgi:hypothetical protein